MSYEDVVSEYRIDDICPEIDNELNGMFVDILGDDFEIGIFPEGDAENEDLFLVTVEIVCEGATLKKDQAQKIKSAVEERLFHMLGDDADTVRESFGGVQIILNEDIVG